MFGFLKHWDVACYGAAWVDEVGGIERCAARFALVAIGARVVAVGAFACYITIGEKLVGFLVKQLHRGFLHKLPVVVETAEEFRCR